MNGFLLVDKPYGLSSHDVVQRVRRMSGIRRVGHAGTLDPMATGVLVVALGKATRLNEYLLHGDKAYRATVSLGAVTPSYDAETEITEVRPVTVDLDDIRTALPQFTGEIMQVPPAYSAIKRDGERSYALARRGEEVALDARPIHIYRLHIVAWQTPELVLDVFCGGGTYIRSLAHDLGQVLGCGGHLSALQRTQAGPFGLEETRSLDELAAAFDAGRGAELLLPMHSALPDWPAVRVSDDERLALVQGRPIAQTSAPAETGLAAAVDSGGELVAVVQGDATYGTWRPKKVLV